MTDAASMQDAEIYLKTEAGRDEIKSRARGLSMAMRAILLMVDGQRDVAALREFIAGSKAPADALEALAAQGLIESRSAAPVPAAPVAAPPPVSIATPRSETLARATAPPIAAAAPARFGYDDPLDLTLPTIFGSDEWAAPAQGHTAPAPSQRSAKDRYEHLYTMINEVVRDFLPAHRRYLIQLKIERAGTPDELLALLDTVQAALVKAKGDEFAAGVIARLRAAAA